MIQEAREFSQTLCAWLDANADRLTLDADVHATDLDSLSGARRERYLSSPDYYHGRPISAEDIIAEMDSAQVDAALTWQNPAATAYTNDQDHNFQSLLRANTYIRDISRRYPQRFIPGGWTDPKACGIPHARRIAEICVQEFGFLFVKMNPAQNRYPIDSPEVLEMVDHIVSLGAIPVFHFGADSPYTPAEGLEALALRHPAHPILAIHMGGGGAAYEAAENLYQNARLLGLRQPNIRFALSAKRDTHIESDLIRYQLAGPPFCHNLFCASDAPYGRMTWNFGGYRAMFAALIDGPHHTDPRVRQHPNLFTPETAQNYLGRNFARFVSAGYRQLLHLQDTTASSCLS